MVKPGVPRSTRKVVSFFLGIFASSSPVATKTITKSACSAPEMKCLVPLMTQSPLSRRAVVFMPRMSEPASGSVMASASIRSPRTAGRRYRSICSPVQAIRMFCGRPKKWFSAIDPRPSSRSTSANSRWFRPAPPTLSGKLQAKKPRSIVFRLISAAISPGTVPRDSTSFSWG